MFEGSQVSVRIIEGIQIYGKKDAITEMEKIGPKGEGKKKPWNRRAILYLKNSGDPLQG
jgi:hypothetical protein